MSHQEPVSVETARAILDAFNAHDLDAIMEFFADDGSLDLPRGPDPWGQCFVGKVAVRAGLATRFTGLPDVHYSDERGDPRVRALGAEARAHVCGDELRGSSLLHYPHALGYDIVDYGGSAHQVGGHTKL